jgi:hypothetical protein
MKAIMILIILSKKLEFQAFTLKSKLKTLINKLSTLIKASILKTLVNLVCNFKAAMLVKSHLKLCSN